MAERRPNLVRLKFAGAWVALTLVLAALAGWWGLVTAVVLAAAALAGVHPLSIMRLGALVLLTVPVVVILNDLPAARDISSGFAVDNLRASQLAFSGMALVICGGLADVGGHHRRSSEGGP